MVEHEGSDEDVDVPPPEGEPGDLPNVVRRTRRTADEIRQRSEEIRIEAERIRSLTMITLLNVDINYRTAQKAYNMVMRNAQEEDERQEEDEPVSYLERRRDRRM